MKIFATTFMYKWYKYSYLHIVGFHVFIDCLKKISVLALLLDGEKTMIECIDASIFHQLSSILAINWSWKEKRNKFRLLYQVCRFTCFVVVSQNEAHSRGNSINNSSYAICNLRIILCIARTFKGQNSPHLILSKTTSW